MGYKMNSKKRRIAIKGCCAFIASASPLTLAMYRADTVYGEVDFRQGLTVITAASLIIAMFQIAVSMWYEKNSSRCDKTASASLRIKTAYAILEWAALVSALLLMAGALRIICPGEPIPYKGLLIAAAAGLLLSVAAIWILSRKKREIK